MKKFLLTVLLALSCLIINAQWSDDPAENNRITALGTSIYDFDLGVSGNGTSFITFNRPMGGNTATLLQIVDISGNMLFSEEGMMVSSESTLSWTQVNDLMFVDDDGNAIIAVSDCRNSAGEELSYTLYKVSPTGEMLWGANGIDLCGGMAYELIACMKIIQLEDGSYVCAWSVNQGNDTYIQLQKISKTGTLLWNNVRIQEPSYMNEYPYLVNAGNNQVIVAYSRKTGSLYADRNLRARKLASDGSNVWANDLSIFTGWFGMIPLWVNMRVIADQTGGAFVGWCDFRVSKGTTYIAHVKGNGTLGFDGVEGGVKVGTGPLRGFQPEMYVDTEEGFLYTTWRETIDDMAQAWQRIAAQKLKVATGELMWDTNGVAIFPYTHNVSLGFYSIQGGNANNVAIFFTVGGATWGTDTHKVTLINKETGGYVWNDEIITFSTISSAKDNLISTPLQFNSYWLTLWGDERVVPGYPSGIKKLYMQRINIDGTLGDNGTGICLPPTNVVVEPSWHNDAEVSWEGEAADYEVSYRIVDEEWISETVIGAHYLILENLQPSTDYQVRVRSLCSNDQTSDWSEIISFTTPDAPPPCKAPVNLNVTEITHTSAKLSWKAGSDSNAFWDLRYRETSSTTWNGAEYVLEKTYLLEELTPNTAYLWTVRARCSDGHGEISPWAEENGFTTDPVGIDNVSKEQITVYASGKMISIINPENRYIENIQLFDINGRLLGDYTVKATDNVLIPTAINEMILIIKIFGENGAETHKVLMR